MGRRASLDGFGKSRSHRDSNPLLFRPYKIAIPTILSLLTTTTTNMCHENLERYESAYSKENKFTINSRVDGLWRSIKCGEFLNQL